MPPPHHSPPPRPGGSAAPWPFPSTVARRSWYKPPVVDDTSRLRLLYDLGCAFATHLELDELVPLIIEKCREELDAEAAAVLLLDADRRELHFPYVADEAPDVA